jgi:hypothetical protein
MYKEKIMKNRFMFLRKKNQQPIGCLAIKLTENTIEYQLSVLNPVDKFDRSFAKQLANERLDKNPFKINLTVTPTMYNISTAVMANLAFNNKDAPKRAIKAAKLWLYCNY